MKKSLLKHFFAFIAALLLAIGCTPSVPPPGPDPDPDPVVPTITVSVANLDFNTDGVPQKLTITANGSWTISSDKAWCKLSSGSGSTGSADVTVSVDVNTDMNIREATITAVCGTASKTIKVAQLGEAPAMLISSTDGYIVAAGGKIDIKVTTNIPYEITLPAWLKKAVKSDTKLMVAYDHSFEAGNYTETESPRFGDIVISQKGGDIKKTVRATQLMAAPSQTVDLYVKEPGVAAAAAVSNGGGVVEVRPSGKVSEVVVEQSWVKVITGTSAVKSFMTKAAPDNIAFVVEQNNGETRSAYVYIHIEGGNIDSLQFKQIGDKITIMASVDKVEVAPTKGEFVFTVMTSANVKFNTTIDAKWLTFVKADDSAAKNQTTGTVRVPITIGYDASYEVENREALITISSEDGSSTAVVKVVQKGYGKTSMYLNTKKETVSASGGSVIAQLVFRAGTADFKCDISKEWITRLNDKDPVFVVAENETVEPRDGKIIFMQVGGSAVDTLYITQLGRTEDEFNLKTDSVAVLELLNSLAKLDKRYDLPNGIESMTNAFLYNRYGITLEPINGGLRVVSVVIPQIYPMPTIDVDLPESFWTLSQAKNIDIRVPVKGSISKNISSMKNLQALRLTDTRIGGELPAEIGGLKTLRRIDIRSFNGEGMPITSIPAEMANMSNLKEVHLFTDMQKLPEYISQLGVEVLFIDNKGALSSDFVPSSIGNLRNVKSLVIVSDRNKDSGYDVPAELFNISPLKEVQLQINKPLPSTISNSGVERIHIRTTLPSFLPSDVRVPQSLRALYITNPNFEELTDEMVAPNLSEIQITSNKFKTMSSFVGNLTNLNVLFLIGHDELLDIPSCVYDVKGVRELAFFNVKGELSEDITKLSRLTHLQIINGSVGGEISENMWKFFLANLGKPLSVNNNTFRLNIAGNQFVGKIPEFVTKSASWKENGHPSEGVWMPMKLIFPQQKGYGFDDIVSTPPPTGGLNQFDNGGNGKF